ncbi:MAG: rhodanese-like domain-containing protein [Bacteroidota bacterium]
MPRILFSSTLLLLLTSCMYGQKTQADFHNMLADMYRYSVPLVKSAELKTDSSEVLLLDTREKNEFEVAHLDGAKWVGYDDFQSEALAEVPKDKPIVVYCSVGYRSERIGEKLQEMGFTNVRNLYGGIFQWKNEGNDVVNKTGQSTEKVHTFNANWSQWLLKGEKVY